ncbi:MAG: SIMPL domain-containing protein [Solirubrobacteraceae bacterium]|nr:SIMPL domain-containing protein [Solirubrobacteraceae bacterium]
MQTRRLLLAAALGTLALPAAAHAQAPAQPTVEAYGTGSADVEPRDKRSNASIAAAVDRAEEAALPRAVADARANAAKLAAAAGLTLGGLVSVSNESQATPFIVGPWGQDGTFGPGRYCGTVRIPRYKTVGGKRRRIGTRSERRCRVPGQAQRGVKLTFAASAPPA